MAAIDPSAPAPMRPIPAPPPGMAGDAGALQVPAHLRGTRAGLFHLLRMQALMASPPEARPGMRPASPPPRPAAAMAAPAPAPVATREMAHTPPPAPQAEAPPAPRRGWRDLLAADSFLFRTPAGR